jgi:DNA helicase-2/ATP-dependent DNA helicase PcrA
MLKELGEPGASSPALDIERIIPFYKPLLKRNHENPEPRLNDIEHLAQLARNFRSRQAFLTELALDPPASTGDFAGPPGRDEDWLVLSTIHSAKGGEWDVVFLVHAADGFLPSDMATGSREELDEELRLTYVAMTRGRDFLYVCWPLRYFHRPGRLTDSHSYAQCCRFLTPDVRATMEETSTGQAPDADQPAEVTPKADIADKLRGRWE